MNTEQVQALKVKRLCSNCVGEDYLSDEIAREGKRLKCSYCGSIDKCYLIGELSERINDAFDSHYRRTSVDPDPMQYAMMTDKESDYNWQRDGEPSVYAIMNAADIPEHAAQDVQQILEEEYSDFESAKVGEETEFDSDAHYEQKVASDAAWQEEWQSFERSLKTEARFFSKQASDHLSTVFEGIDRLKTSEGRSLIVDAGPGKSFASLYRARVFQSASRLEEALCRPDQHLGSPPSVVATAGRMNARGISVFYGASDPHVALAEVRPPVGSQVAVARFDIIRPIKLLDLPAFSEVVTGGSIFDSATAGRLERATFLRSLGQRITRPVMPDDEAFEYLATQAVADFLATNSTMPIDGIIFNSVQAAGDALNAVLFHKASRVETIAISPGTELRADTARQTEDGWEHDYTVIEEVPAEREEVEQAVQDGLPDFAAIARTSWDNLKADHDWRLATLRIAVDSVKVHIVRRVQFETDDHVVRRYRWQKDGPDQAQF